MKHLDDAKEWIKEDEFCVFHGIRDGFDYDIYKKCPYCNDYVPVGVTGMLFCYCSDPLEEKEEELETE